MKEITEISFERIGETRGYYLFSVIVEEKNPSMHPKKIYLRKDLFAKQTKFIQITVTEKGGK